MTIFKRRADRRRIRRLAEGWQVFRASLEPWFGRPEATAPARRERAFLAVKARVAHRLPVLGQVYGRRALEQEAIAAMRDMTELMNRMSSLADAARLGDEERDELLREWHVLYLFLRKLEGTLTGSTTDGVVLAAAERSENEAAQLIWRQSVSGSSAFLGFVLRAAVIVALVVVAARFLGIDGDDIRSWLPTARQSEGAAVAQAPTGETEDPAPAAPFSLNAVRMPRLVQPVVMRYGTVGLAALCGVMLLGTFALFRARSR